MVVWVYVNPLFLPYQWELNEIMDKKILLHICCAPCSIEVIDALVKDGYEIFGYFYNPNIHPYDEYNKRRDSVVSYLNELGIKYEIADYDMYDYFHAIGENTKGMERCVACYDFRLAKSAQRAKELGFSKYSTTLLWNPHKDFNFIAEVGIKNAEKLNLEFYFPKLEHDYWGVKKKSKEAGLYIQKYCGCVFSSWENHSKIKKDNL